MKLVVYASKHGSTKQSATELAERLQADIVDVTQNANISLDRYDTVLIGSPIYVGQILKPMAEFCKANLDTLKSKNIGLFTCCGYEEKALELIDQIFPKELTEIAFEKAYFGYTFEGLGFFEKAICRMIGAPIGTTNILTSNIEAFAEKFK